MAKKPPKKPKLEEIETEPDAWERFEKTIGKIVPPKRPKPKAGDDRCPPRQHQEDVGRTSGKRSSQTGEPGKGKAKQKQRESR